MEFIKKRLKRIAEKNQAEHDKWASAGQSTEDIKTIRKRESIESLNKLDILSEVKVNFCSGCGVKQNKESRFCFSCGKSLVDVAKPIEVISAEPLKSETNPVESERVMPSWSQPDRKKVVPKPKGESWYSTKWVGIWLIIFFPIGLYGLIKRAEPEDKKKWWAGMAGLFFAVIFIVSSHKSNQSTAYANIAPFTKGEVCKGVIASAAARPVNIMGASQSGGVINVTYRRPDNKRWKYRCKLEGDKGIWAMDGGRWRTHSMDSKITFEVVNSILYIKSVYGDGSSGQKVFRKSSF
jgi:hypothetical protein